jgi:REP-associated tyrosine transposase
MLARMKRLEKRSHRRSYDLPGHAHELTFSCYHRYPFLNAERTCLWLAEAIEQARSELNFYLWAYVFMPEHVHLVVMPPATGAPIRAILQSIKEPVGRKAINYLVAGASAWLDRVTRKRGRRVERLFWQSGGGYDRNITEPGTLWSIIEYLHLNPVRRGLVARAEEWRWSSARSYAGMGQPELRVDQVPLDWVGAFRMPVGSQSSMG